MNTTAFVDILVVGAGPAGLTTAISASRHGASVLLVERHPGTSIHPRAIGITTRSMEVFRTWGIDAAVRAADIGVVSLQTSGYTLADLTGTPTPVGYPLPAESLAVSPVSPGTTPQDHLEPLLLAEAERSGTRVLFDTELSELRVDHRGVRAVVTNRVDGSVLLVQARYVVGADGVRSTVRRSLGICSERLGLIGDFVQVLFRADLDSAVAGRRYFLYAIEHPDAPGVMLPAGDGRWVFALPWSDTKASPGGVDPAYWAEKIRIATGIADLEPEIQSVLPFTMAADVATTFQDGRGFLVGDAAHRMTPMGGVGMNTGIHDGHNLGWKLAWRVRGWAGDELVDSYTVERRPVGLRNAVSSLQPGRRDAPGGFRADLGSRYRSTVVQDFDAALDVGCAPKGQPGQRAPHRWVQRNGRRISTVDLFDRTLTLLTGGAGADWRRAVPTGVPLRVLSFGDELVPLSQDRPAAGTYGIEPDGAVLVRPDGYISWRWDRLPADPAAALATALDVTLGRRTEAVAVAG